MNGVTITDMVNTVQAYRNLQQALAGRTLAAAQQTSAQSDDALMKSLGLSSTNAASSNDGNAGQQDSVQLSGNYGSSAADPAASSADSTDNSLGAIIESFLSQRQTYKFTIPGVGGMTSPISVTWEVQKAYHVIQFVPQSQVSQLGQSVDQQA
jgi:hypothetical protein